MWRGGAWRDVAVRAGVALAGAPACGVCGQGGAPRTWRSVAPIGGGNRRPAQGRNLHRCVRSHGPAGIWPNAPTGVSFAPPRPRSPVSHEPEWKTQHVVHWAVMETWRGVAARRCLVVTGNEREEIKLAEGGLYFRPVFFFRSVIHSPFRLRCQAEQVFLRC